jgi:DNA sulfur modification protein DndD
MIIREVQIENFFCFVGIEKFTFEEGLNIVSAKNSGGKSHLFNAFHWTFFNNVYVDKDNDSSTKEWKSADKVITLPDYISDNAKIDDILRTSVKITLSIEYHDNDEVKGEIIDYHFEKELKFKKTQTEIFPIAKPELQIWYVKDGETKYLEKGEFTWFLNKIFPISIRKFMWFQGETVDELYDFSNPSTLNYAINEISYFPIYENLASITKASEQSIGKKIDAELRKVRRFTDDQERIIADIDLAQKRINNFENSILECRNEILNLSEAIITEENKLKGYDKYSILKTKLNKLEYDIKTVNDKIDFQSVQGKEKFISKWMLNKCDTLIIASSKNLDLLSKEIKSFQKNDNPVPITLPGPEYVQKMLDDHICYICEREVVEGTPAFDALKARMEDFRANQTQKILSDNFTELNRFKRNLLNELPGIKKEVEENDLTIQKLIDLRRKLLKQKENLFTDSGISDSNVIISGSTTAEQILNKIRSLNSSKSTTERKLSNYLNDQFGEQRNLDNLNDKKSKILVIEDSDEITETQAKKYIDVISMAVSSLKKAALTQLINEITEESNILYSKYLGGNTQGRIEIDRGVRIIDNVTKKQLTNIGTAHLTAQKLAVANAFLSLSEKKMNRSFPLLADAPTSQFDDENTRFLTENLSESFKQIIIMSKDYNKLVDLERSQFIEKAKVSKYYELRNELIDKEGIDSRTNKKTFIITIK